MDDYNCSSDFPFFQFETETRQGKEGPDVWTSCYPDRLGMTTVLNRTRTFIDVPTIDTYLQPFDWEHVNLNNCRQWMGRNWTLSVYASALYVLLIFSGQHWMKTRSPFSLRRRLLVWNIALAIFSMLGFLRTFPEILYVVRETGFYRSVCERKDHNSATAFWGWFMTLSKLLELGDTAFVVLRKQPLIFALVPPHHSANLLLGYLRRV